MLREIGMGLVGLVLGALLVSPVVLRAAELSPEERARLQRDSLGFVWYADGPRPAPPGAAELQSGRRAVEEGPEIDREYLKSFYGDDVEMWVYAIRDSDGDGVFDFRVSDYHGKFLEGDIDLDGDGVVNTLDVAPYERSTEGSVPAALPAHLDWALQGKPASMVLIQKELYERLGITLVDRSESFSEKLTQSVYDALVKVYQLERLATLETIAMEERSLLDPDDEQGKEDFAQMMPATRTLVIYGLTRDSKPVVQLGVLTHEIAHALQFAMDFDDARRGEIERRNYVAAPRFYRSMRRFGWSTVLRETDPEEEFSLFRPHYASPKPYEVFYNSRMTASSRGETPEAWTTWLQEIYDEVGEDYLLDPRVAAHHMVGNYSMENPWEWYGDYAIASLFVRMFDSLEAVCSEAELGELRAEFQEKVVKKQWPDFAYDNARGTPMLAHLETIIPMSDADAQTMAKAYVLGELPGHCNAP